MSLLPEPRVLSLDDAVHTAMLAPADAGPVWLRDGGDDVSLGAPGDGTALLWALLDLGAPDALLLGLVDPIAVSAALAAGPGATLDLALGGASGDTGFPIDVHASVVNLGEDPLGGRTAILGCTGRYEHTVDVLICERPIPQLTPELLATHAVAPASKRIIAIKGDLALNLALLGQEIILVTTPGPTNSDVTGSS